MLYQTVTLQRVNHVMVVTINYPMNDKGGMARLSDELAELSTEAAWDEEVRVIIITGAGEKSFSMEGCLNGEISGTNEEQEIKFLSLAESIAKLDRPVIAAIHGDAIGQGLELALACDIRVAAETSRFGLPHIRKGLIPWDGGTQRLSRMVGRGKALEMILTGETIDVQEALRMGLVNRVVPAGELMKVVMEIAQEIASRGPIAIRYAKEAIYKGMDMTLEQGLHLEAGLYLLLHTTEDRTKGIQAFREKKASPFEGR